jgi:hypothetical protein
VPTALCIKFKYSPPATHWDGGTVAVVIAGFGLVLVVGVLSG